MLARFLPEERPYIIQLFGNDPEHFKVAARVLTEKFTQMGLMLTLAAQLGMW